MDTRWLQKRAIYFFVSLFGIFVAATIPGDPNKVATTTTNMIAPPATNPFTNCVAASAIVEAYGDNTIIGSPFSGIIQKRFVNAYDVVKEGDPIFELDTRSIQAKIETDKAQIKVNEENLKLLEIQLKRLESISDSRAVSAEQITTKKSEIDVAKANLELAHRELEKDEVELKRYTIRAPKDGTILKIDYHAGEYITGNNTSDESIILGDIRNLQVRVDVDEQNASRVHPGQKAIGYPRGVVKKAFQLEFMRIEPYAIPKKNLTGNSNEIVDTRVLQVIYKLTPIEGFNVYPGQQFDVYIEAEPVTPYVEK